MADPGAGKTAITLRAFKRLKDAGIASRMLVIAPKRVCELVWRQEAQKWTEFRELRFSHLHGPKKNDRLKDDADIWLMNPEGVQWLAQQYFGRRLPFDTVCIDELTKFKNSSADRVKKLRPRLAGVKRRWGLTGTLVPNGYMDLFGEMLMLDDGAALGRFITHYRDTYFTPDFNGFDYVLQPGAAKRIEDRIAPYCYRLPYTELPPIVDDPRFVELTPAERKIYDAMRKDMLVNLPGGLVTAANGGATYSKLKQMANGAVYTDDGGWVQIHDQKLDAVEELFEELNQGSTVAEVVKNPAGCTPLLIGYEFRHDLERLQKRFPGLRTFDGVSEKVAVELERAWNNNEVPLLAAHPASIGHGLNLQQGAACHVAWFSPTIDYELYDQFIRRLRRRGNAADRVVNHLFLAKNTVDDTLTLPAIEGKGKVQDGLLTRLAAALGTHATGERGTIGDSIMVAKLSQQAPGATSGAEKSKIVPKGWGTPKSAAAPATTTQTADETAADGAEAAQALEAQRERVAATLKGEAVTQPEGPSPAERARSAFSSGIQSKLAEAGGASLGNPLQEPAGGEKAQPEAQEPATAAPAEKPKRTTTRIKPPAEPSTAVGDDGPSRTSLPWHDTAIMGLKVQVLAMFNGDVGRAREAWAFITE